MKNTLKTFVILSIILDVLVRNFGEKFPDHFYYKAEAIMMFSFAALFFHYKNNIFTFIIIGLTFNNLIDELLFNPLKLNLNEIIFSIIFIILSFYKYAPRKRILRIFN